MNKDQEKVWDRLKHGIPKQPMPSTEEIRMAFMRGARSMGKTTLAMQALGRALREIKKDEVAHPRKKDSE